MTVSVICAIAGTGTCGTPVAKDLASKEASYTLIVGDQDLMNASNAFAWIGRVHTQCVAAFDLMISPRSRRGLGSGAPLRTAGMRDAHSLF